MAQETYDGFPTSRDAEDQRRLDRVCMNIKRNDAPTVEIITNQRARETSTAKSDGFTVPSSCAKREKAQVIPHIVPSRPAKGAYLTTL